VTFGTLFWLVAVLGFVTALALLSGGDPGYVLISRTPYEIEVSLSLLLFGLLVTTTLIYFLIIFQIPEAVAAILSSALSSQVKKTNDLVFF